MVFLNPAVLFGLFAAAIPVLIHLLNLRKLEKIEFSTLSFLKELQKTKIKRIKLKQWILLALRILIILFLVASFARPTLQSAAIGGAASAAKTSAVFILDNSFSMSIVTENGSYFNQAKQVIKSLLNEFEEGDDITIVLTSGKNKKDYEPSKNLSAIKKYFDEINISYISGTIHSAIVKAGQILEQSKNFNKEIYLLTDFQKSRLYNNPSELSDLSQLFDDKTKLYVFDLSEKEVSNLSVTDFKVNNQIFELGKPISFTATVSNYSQQGSMNSVGSLFINGNRSAQQSVNINAGESKQVNFETTLKDGGLLEIFIELEEDEILQDNRRYLSLFVPEKISLIIFTDQSEDSKFIKIALTETSESQKIEMTEKKLNQISSVNLNNYNAVIVVGAKNINNYQRLNDYIQNGGSLLLMPGSKTTIENFQKLCAALNLPQPSGSNGAINNSASSSSFEAIEFLHPIFNNLFENGKKPGIDSPDIYFYYKLSTMGKGKNIISLVDGSSFLGEYMVGKGKVLLFNTAPALSWSNFPLKGIFAPIINKSIFYLTSNVKSTDNYISGDEILVNLGNSFLPQLIIVHPDGNEDYINLDSLKNKKYYSYTNTNLAGIYRFFSGDKLLDYPSVNTSPAESNMDYLDSDEFSDYLTSIKFIGVIKNISIDEDYTTAINQARFGSELWRHFLIAALFLALIEMMVSRSAKKDLTRMK